MVVLWVLRGGAGRAYFATPCKPVEKVETIRTLVAAGWCTVVAALNADSPTPNEIPCNGCSLHYFVAVLLPEAAVASCVPSGQWQHR